MRNLRDGISSNKLKMYILSHKVALFGGSGVKIMRNLCGGISPKILKMYIISYKRAMFRSWILIEIMLNQLGGISPKRPKMNILLTNWHFFLAIWSEN